MLSFLDSSVAQPFYSTGMVNKNDLLGTSHLTVLSFYPYLPDGFIKGFLAQAIRATSSSASSLYPRAMDPGSSVPNA